MMLLKNELDQISDGDGLLQLFLSGDENSFSALYRLYVHDLYSYGMSLTGDPDLVKDALQDTFCKLYFQKSNLRSVSNIKYYLLRMLKNRLIDLRKSRSETVPLSELSDNFTITVSMLDNIIESEEREIVQQKVEKVLSCLTGRQREAIYLRFIQELEYDELARILDMSPHAVRKLISRSIKRLREQDPMTMILLALFCTQ